MLHKAHEIAQRNHIIIMCNKSVILLNTFFCFRYRPP